MFAADLIAGTVLYILHVQPVLVEAETLQLPRFDDAGQTRR